MVAKLVIRLKICLLDGTGALLSYQFSLVYGGYVRPSDIRPTTNQCEVLGSPGIILVKICNLFLFVCLFVCLGLFKYTGWFCPGAQLQPTGISCYIDTYK